jgi:pimeloyl-ACP methyl ester carboxylesterase
MTGLVDEPTLHPHEHIIRHATGRGVCCSILGARDFKRCLFYSHGFPASRHEAVLAHRAALDTGLTIIALDRPGYGGSDWYPGRMVGDWAEDVRLVADHFRIGSFAVLGVSGGAPTAVAAAALLPERVDRLVVVSGVGAVSVEGALEGMNPVNASILRAGVGCQWMAKGAIAALATMWRTAPVTAKLWFAALLPRADIEIVRRRDVGLIMAKNLHEALRQGVRGTVTDFEMLLSDWSDYVPLVRAPTTIWHGDADTYVPISMARKLHERIPHSIFHQVEGGGHFMIVDRLSNILSCAA